MILKRRQLWAAGAAMCTTGLALLLRTEAAGLVSDLCFAVAIIGLAVTLVLVFWWAKEVDGEGGGPAPRRWFTPWRRE
jgi:uncharacterized membrane protein